MEPESKYLTLDDEKKIKGFLDHYASRFFAIPGGPLYHYTTGENLVRIIEGQEIWSTQVSCLNDTKEAVYAVEQLQMRVKARLSSAHTSEVGRLLGKLDELLSQPAVEVSPAFVACFSERRDDLSQWRAYASGEGGYAIQFDQNKLRQCGVPKALLVRVEYDPANHASMFDDVIKWSEQYFLGLDGAKRAPTIDMWLDEFIEYWIRHISFYAPCIKHPKFSDENEWRLVCYLGPDDAKRLKFRQRQSMMARHLPLELQKPLPITGVIVGPCRHPPQSKVAVGDLLLQAGYDMALVKVETTEVPYRSA